jgi:hypothetical protein
MGVTDQEATDLMEKQTFQEHEEATAKLRRAKLSSCRLPTYLVGCTNANKFVVNDYVGIHFVGWKGKGCAS